MPGPVIEIQIVSIGADRVKREVEQLRRMSATATGGRAGRPSQAMAAADREATQRTRARLRDIELEASAWDRFRTSLGGTDRQIVQTRRAKEQLRVAVAAGTITQDRANESLRRYITRLRETGAQAAATRSVIREFAQLAAGQAVASAVPGIGGFALGSAIGRSGGLLAAGGIVGGVAVAAAAGQLAIAANQIRLLQAQLRAFSPDAKAADQAFAGLIATSQTTGTAIADNAVLMRRLTQAQKDLGASTTDVISFQETVQKLMIASGAATSEASAGTLQLSQALASGKVQGDEFRSVMENMTAVARVAAQGLYEMGRLTKPTIGELNRLREAGRLTSKDFFQAVLSQGEQANKLFAGMPQTLGRSAAGVANEFKLLTAQWGEASGVLDLLIGGMEALADAMRAIREIGEIKIKITAPGMEAMPEGMAMRGAQKLDSIIRDVLEPGWQQREAQQRRLAAKAPGFGTTLLPQTIRAPIPQLLERPSIMGPGTRAEVAQEQEGTLRLMREELALGKQIAGAQRDGRDAVRETEVALRAQLLAREKGLSTESEYIRIQKDIWRLQDANAVFAAQRAEITTQEGLRNEIAARGQQTEELRIQNRLLEAREQHGETALQYLAAEIVATEKLRTELEGVSVALEMDQHLEDLRLATQYAGQQTEQYRIQARELELSRRLLRDLTEEERARVRLIEQEATKAQQAATTQGLKEQLQDLQVMARFNGRETEEYRVQAQLLEIKRRQLTDATTEQEKLVRQVQRETTELEKQRAINQLSDQAAQQRLSLRQGFSGRDILSQEFLGVASEQSRIEQRTLEMQQQLGTTNLGPQLTQMIADSERLNTQIAVMNNLVPDLADGFASLAETAIFEGLDDAAQQLYRTIVRITLEVVALRVAMSAAGAFFGPGVGGAGQAGIGTAAAPAATGPVQLSPFFGGGRQHGGRVSRNMGYMVGEHGAEFFKPDTAGTIMTGRDLDRYFRQGMSPAPANTPQPQIVINDQRGRGAPPVETSVDARGVISMTIQSEVTGMARRGELQRMVGTRRAGISRG